MEDVRRRDEERLGIQLGGNAGGGAEAPSPVTPEPLIEPGRRTDGGGSQEEREDAQRSAAE